MKTYEVEVQRTSSIAMTVQANSREEAEALAWRRVEDNEPNIYDSEWSITLIEEQGE